MSSPAPQSADPFPLEEAYRACDRITRREGRNFAWGFVFLSAPQRRAMNALYAFARATDDLVDDETLGVAERADRIAGWRAAAETAFSGRDPGDALRHAGLSDLAPSLVAMADTVRAFGVPQDELLLLVEGCREDLTPRRYETWDETLLYCRKVAVTVGMAMLAVFGSRDEAMRRAMESIGYAFQLTNILRDVPEDWGRGRVYLPQELLRKHNVAEQELAAGPPIHAVVRVLRDAADRAEAHYEAARPLESGLAPGPARTMRAMHRIYRGILDAIRAQNYDVWSRRPGLSTGRKLAILAGTLLPLR